MTNLTTARAAYRAACARHDAAAHDLDETPEDEATPEIEREYSDALDALTASTLALVIAGEKALRGAPGFDATGAAWDAALGRGRPVSVRVRRKIAALLDRLDEVAA